MLWWKPQRSPRRHEPVRPDLDVGASPAVEAGALLVGRIADLLDANGRPVPCWAWLNAVAHRRPDELAELARDGNGSQPVVRKLDDATFAGGPLVTAVIAAALLKRSGGDEAAMSALQHDCLIPLELELLSGRIAVTDPGQVLHLALLALHTGRCPHGG